MTERAHFEVLETRGGLEIRAYPKLVIATVHGYYENDAFRKLFHFISGENEAASSIAMTVPVVMNTPIKNAKIAMTVPVVEDEDRMSFILPSKYDERNAPRPTNKDVRLEVVPARKVAVLKFKGNAWPKQIAQKREELMDMVKKEGLTAKGKPYEMYYNGPGVPGILRHNEVAVEID